MRGRLYAHISWALLIPTSAFAKEPPLYHMRLLAKAPGADCGISKGLSERGHVVVDYGPRLGFKAPHIHAQSNIPVRLPGNISSVDGVNDLGFSVGGSLGGSPVLWAPSGDRIELPVGRFVGGFAMDLNERFEIVGRLEDSTGIFRGVVWRNGVLEEIEGLGSTTHLFAISSHGHVVGLTWSPGGQSWALYHDGETLHTVLPFGRRGAGSFEAINNRGQAAGHAASRVPQFDDFVGTQAFVWDLESRRVTPIGWLSDYGYVTRAHGINDHGQVVGFALWQFPGESPEARGFLWEGGRIYELNTLVSNLPQGANIVTATDIDNRGQILAEIDLDPVAAQDRRLAILEPTRAVTPARSQ